MFRPPVLLPLSPSYPRKILKELPDALCENSPLYLQNRHLPYIHEYNFLLPAGLPLFPGESKEVPQQSDVHHPVPFP